MIDSQVDSLNTASYRDLEGKELVILVAAQT
jgi:hypothetical protein